MSTILKNEIIKQLNAINWSNEDSTVNSDRTFEAIITGIYNYINENYIFNGTFAGVHSTTPTPTPVIGTSTHSLHIINTSWLNTFKTIVRNGIVDNGVQRIFQGIQTMLLGNVQADITSLITVPPITVLPPLGTPLVPVVFPSIVSFGTPCQLEILGTKPKTKEDAWAIISKYIQQGLNINIVTPIPTSGVITFPTTGLTTGVLSFN